jgi:hypothetical protein
MRSTLATMWLIQIMPVFCASGTFRRTRTHSRSKKNDVLLRNAREHFLANSRNNKFYEIRTEGMFHDIPSTIDRCWRPLPGMSVPGRILLQKSKVATI